MKEQWEKIGEINGPDSKNRITIMSLLKGRVENVDGFIVYISPVGEIKLEPQVKIPAKEAWLYKNPQALKQVKEGIEDALAGRVGPLSRKRLKSK